MATEAARLKNPANYDTCPNCGKVKHKRAITCSACRRQPQNQEMEYMVQPDLSPLFLAEFRGLFYGEGSAMIIRNNTSYAPCLAIRLRDDDSEMIMVIQWKMGGRYLKSERQSKNPRWGNQFEWRTTNVAHCEHICRILLDGKLPAKKLRDIELVREFCLLRLNGPVNFTEPERREAERLFLELREGRKYHSL